MKHLLVFAVLLIAACAQAQIHLTAAISGADEVPPS